MEAWAQEKRAAEEERFAAWLQEHPEPQGEGAEALAETKKWRTLQRQEKDVFDFEYGKEYPQPKRPGDITLAQLAKKSEAATMVRDIVRQLDSSESNSATVEVMYGKVEVLIGFEPAGSSSDDDGKLGKNRRWEVVIGGYSAFRWDAVHPPELKIMAVFRDGEIRKYLKDRVKSAKGSQDFNIKAISEAERILEKVKFEDGPKLEQKRERYKAVVEGVNALEQALEAKRESEPNIYISGDSRRFGGYNPGKAAYMGRRQDNVNTEIGKVTEIVRSDESSGEVGAALQAIAGGFLGASVTEVSVSSRAARLVQQIGNTFGRDVVFFKGQDASGAHVPIDGVVFENDTKRIFINAFSGDPHLFVLGHELVHSLKDSDGGLYKSLARQVMPLVRRWGVYRNTLERNMLDSGLEPLQDDHGYYEEFLGDLVSDNFKNAEFWESLAAGEPGIFRRIAQKTVRLLTRIINSLTGAGFNDTD